MGDNNLTIPPLLEADFARIQTLLRVHHSADVLIHAVSEPVTCQSTPQSCSMSSSQKGNWVAIGNVCCTTNQDITFEEEVAQCFRDLQGSSTSIEETLF